MSAVESLDYDERSGYSKVHSYSTPSRSRPADVGKIFNKNQRYSGRSAENLRSRYRHFIDACNLPGVDTMDCGVMIPLMATLFLTGQAEIFFSKRARSRVGSPNEAIDALEAQFLDKRALRINDEVWAELSFQFVKQKRLADKLPARHEQVLNELLRQIVELGRMGTS